MLKTITITIFPDISKPNQIKKIGAIEINGIVCAAHKSGNKADLTSLQIWKITPKRIPTTIAIEKPITVSCVVINAAGNRVGKESAVD